jgi:hypothetical protein
LHPSQKNHQHISQTAAPPRDLVATSARYLTPSSPCWDSGHCLFAPGCPILHITTLAVQSVVQRPGQPLCNSLGSAAPDSTRPRSAISPPTFHRPWGHERRVAVLPLLKKEDSPSATTVGRASQCPGPWVRERVGDQVSMSQRGPAPRPGSRRSSTSPQRDIQVSPATQTQQGLGGREDVRADVPHESRSIPFTNGEERSYHIPPRTLGVHTLIHSAEQRSTTSGTPSLARPPETDRGVMGMGAGEYGPPNVPRQFVFQGQGPHGPQQGAPGLPPVSTSGGPQPPSDQGSPTIPHPFPALNNPRHILSPRPPRAASLNRPGQRGLDPRQPPFIPAPRAKRPFHGELGSPSEGPPPPHGFRGPSPLGPPPSTMAAAATPPRSLSQPVLGHLPPTAQDHPPPLPQIPRDSQGRPIFPGQAPFPSGMPGRGFSPSMGPGRELPQSSLYQNLRTGTPKGVVGPPGQHMISINPDIGNPILVPVDMHQASRVADEKRMRNAGASARFRARKKEKEQERDREVSKLQDEKRELQVRIDQLQQDRDFYRDERNRLRDIVLRTPQISELAMAAAPSPTSSRSGGSFAERSPLVTAPHHPHGLAQGYASSETSSIERPTRRRRTDPQPEFTTPSYGPPAAANLPPISGPSYGMIPARPPSAQQGVERLPPLRTMEGPPPMPGSEPVQTPGAPTYPSYTRVPYESGWANRPSGPAGPAGPPGLPGFPPGPPGPPPEGNQR